jgi:hypothetical protein
MDLSYEKWWSLLFVLLVWTAAEFQLEYDMFDLCLHFEKLSAPLLGLIVMSH